MGMVRGGIFWMAVLALVVFSIGVLPSAFAIDCYKCDSTLHAGCQEQFDEATSGLQPVDCATDVYQGQYCVKTTGMYGGKPGTRRFCSSKNLGNHCNFIKRPNEPLDYRACIFTCSGDRCNAGASLDGSFPALLIKLILPMCAWNIFRLVSSET